MIPLSASQQISDHSTTPDDSTDTTGEEPGASEALVPGTSERANLPAGSTGLAGSLWLRAFRDVLQRDDIDEETDFFNAGGYSLLVPQLIARYESLSGWRPPMSLLFDVSSPVELEGASAALLELKRHARR